MIAPNEKKRKKQADTGKPKEKRLNHILPQGLYEEIAALAAETRLPISYLVRYGLALVIIAVREKQKGGKLVINDAAGTPSVELLLPAI